MILPGLTRGFTRVGDYGFYPSSKGGTFASLADGWDGQPSGLVDEHRRSVDGSRQAKPYETARVAGKVARVRDPRQGPRHARGDAR